MSGEQAKQATEQPEEGLLPHYWRSFDELYNDPAFVQAMSAMSPQGDGTPFQESVL